MFLLSIQINILNLYVEGHMKKVWSEFHVLGLFPVLQNLVVFFGKFIVELGLKSFSGKNNSLEDLEEPREFRVLISWVFGKYLYNSPE